VFWKNFGNFSKKSACTVVLGLFHREYGVTEDQTTAEDMKGVGQIQGERGGRLDEEPAERLDVGQKYDKREAFQSEDSR
jgi:hypothetical protein